jgi:hypothetical protein
MEMSGQIHAPAALPLGIGRWVGHRTGMLSLVLRIIKLDYFHVNLYPGNVSTPTAYTCRSTCVCV